MLIFQIPKLYEVQKGPFKIPSKLSGSIFEPPTQKKVEETQLPFDDDEQAIFDNLPNLESKLEPPEGIDEVMDDDEDDSVVIHEIPSVTTAVVVEPTPVVHNEPQQQPNYVVSQPQTPTMSISPNTTLRSGPSLTVLSDFQRHITSVTKHMDVCEICALPTSEKELLEKMLYLDQIPMTEIQERFNISEDSMKYHTINCVIANNNTLIPKNSLFRMQIKELLDFHQIVQGFKNNVFLEGTPDQIIAYNSTIRELRLFMDAVKKEQRPEDLAREINSEVIKPLLIRFLKNIIAEMNGLKSELLQMVELAKNQEVNNVIDRLVLKIGVIVKEQSSISQEKLADLFEVKPNEID